jgi:hypothetical protein
MPPSPSRCVSVLRAAVPVARAADEPPDAARARGGAGVGSPRAAALRAGELKPAVESCKEAYRLTKNPLLLYNIGLIYDKLDDSAAGRCTTTTRFVDDAKDTEKTTAQLAEASEAIRRASRRAGHRRAAREQPTTCEPKSLRRRTLTELRARADRSGAARPVRST